MTFIMLFTTSFIVMSILAGLATPWLLISILWAPFGGLICALRARSLGLPVARFAVVGAAYSMAMLLPWIYLIRQMNRGWFSDGLIHAAYAFLYAVWVTITGADLLLISQGVNTAALESQLFLITLLVSLIVTCVAIYLIRRTGGALVRRSTTVIACAVLCAVVMGLVAIGLDLDDDVLDARMALLFLMYLNLASLVASIIVAWFVPAPLDDPEYPECLLPPFKYIFPFVLMSLNTAARVLYVTSGLISGCC